MNIATIDAKAHAFFDEALGLTNGQFPALVIEDVMSGDTMTFDHYKEITARTVEDFVEEYFGRERTEVAAQVRQPQRPVFTLRISMLRMKTMMNCRILKDLQNVGDDS